ADAVQPQAGRYGEERQREGRGQQLRRLLDQGRDDGVQALRGRLPSGQPVEVDASRHRQVHQDQSRLAETRRGWPALHRIQTGEIPMTTNDATRATAEAMPDPSPDLPAMSRIRICRAVDELFHLR